MHRLTGGRYMRFLAILGLSAVVLTSTSQVPVAAAVAANPVCQTETPAATTSPTYTCLNGSTTFPGTYVGTVNFGANNVRQIGDVRAYNSGGAGAFVNASANPSIYSFNWGGGDLTIFEALGNNGTGSDIGIDLFALASSTATTVSTPISAITVSRSGAVFASNTLFSGYLMAGYYAVDTFLLAQANTLDPAFQINFAVPEPASITLLAGLAVVAMVRRRRAVEAAA